MSSLSGPQNAADLLYKRRLFLSAKMDRELRDKSNVADIKNSLSYLMTDKMDACRVVADCESSIILELLDRLFLTCLNPLGYIHSALCPR